MTEMQLCYLSVPTQRELADNIMRNIDRYRGDGFQDLEGANGWSITLDVVGDLTLLGNLVGGHGVENEVQNSLIVWRALHRLTPALATENRLWTRISHVEGFKYSQARWLTLDRDDDALAKQVNDHFFAPSLTKYRDDHAISRLWWNAYVAKLLRPEDQEGALNLILKKADIRSNLMERAMSFARLSVGKALLRAMSRIPDVSATEDNFRAFMRMVNKFGGGIVFEALEDADCDRFMDECWRKASE